MANTQRLSIQAQQLIEHISAPIGKRESRAIVSDSDTFKSEFVNAIINTDIMEKVYYLPSDRYVFCRVDFETLTEATPGEAYRVFWEAAVKAIEDRMLPAIREEEQRKETKSTIEMAKSILGQEKELIYIEFLEALENFTRAGVALTFVLDNLDSVTKCKLLDIDFFKSLRSLHINRIANFITVSSKTLLDIIPKGNTGSDFHNIFLTEKIKTYSQKQE